MLKYALKISAYLSTTQNYFLAFLGEYFKKEKEGTKVNQTQIQNVKNIQYHHGSKLLIIC